MVESRAVRIALRIASGIVVGFLYLPLVILGIYAFNSSRLQAWPPVSLTFHWFGEAASNPAVTKALVNSLLAASTATMLALVLGTLAAVAVHRFSFFGRQTISFFLVLPIALPGVVSGIALPGLGSALMSGALLAFALSFDEIIVTNFTAGPGTQTIPMWILTAIQRPTELPVVNVVALVLVVASIVPVYLAQRISGGAAAGVAR